jgi:hypothetical protein
MDQILHLLFHFLFVLVLHLDQDVVVQMDLVQMDQWDQI